MQQRIVAADRLGGDHIQPRACDLAAVERVRQILLHDERAAAVVDEDDAVLHLCDRVPVDDALGFGEQRAVQGNHVGLMQQGIEIRILRDFAAGIRFAAPGGEDAHPHCLGDAAGGLADSPEADDAHGFTRELNERVVPKGPVRRTFPAARMHRFGVVRDVRAELQQQRNGKLADGRRAVARHV